MVVSTQVRSLAGTSNPFEVKVSVHQGSALSPLLFNIVMDYLTKDIQSIQTMVPDPHRADSVKNHPFTVPEVSKFKYLGSVLSADANVDMDVAHRVNVAWLRWRSLSGVLCDRRVPIKTKGKVYKTAVRPAMVYGAECWTIKQAHEQKLHVNEMNMLRWAAGVTRLDKVRNEHIRGSYKVAPITDKIQESHLRWCGHIMRRDEDHVVRKALALPNKRGRGPPATWWSTISIDLKQIVEQRDNPGSPDLALENEEEDRPQIMGRGTERRRRSIGS
ncbi:uncharacterized protein LOC134664738 [Cydia fagiglandana]|uniref:uncharacterized protein LOC134664738 n=1 Tax=Cydia fagiglandana TaxID=1458189 RepID=UPI002FEE2C87